jgi:exonuclease III
VIPAIWLAPLGFPFELASHFRLPLSAAGLALFALLGGLGAPRALLGGALAGALVHGSSFFVLTPSVAPPVRGGGGPRLDVVWANLQASREALDAVARGSRGADVVALTDIRLSDVPTLEDRFSGYRLIATSRGVPVAGRIEPREWGSLDVVVLAREGLSARGVQTAIAPHLVVEVDVKVAGAPVRVLAAHPGPGVLPEWLGERNAALERVRELSRGARRFVVLGDFNVTPWSPDYARLPGVRAGDPRFAPTWLSRWPGVGLPIDHVLVDERAEASAVVGPDVGSDHFPLRARVRWPR